jgi:hypothetical protein
MDIDIREAELVERTKGPQAECKRYHNMDPKRGNIIFVDTFTTTTQTEDEKKALLGEWEERFAMGRVTKRDPETKDCPKDPILHYKVYEPYHVGADGEPDLPLWAWAAKERAAGNTASTSWDLALQLPWLEVKQLPALTWITFYADTFKALRPRGTAPFVRNWKGTGVDVVYPLPAVICPGNILHQNDHLSNVASVFAQSNAERAASLSHGRPVIKFDKEEWVYLADLPEVVVSKRRQNLRLC